MIPKDFVHTGWLLVAVLILAVSLLAFIVMRLMKDYSIPETVMLVIWCVGLVALIPVWKSVGAGDPDYPDGLFHFVQWGFVIAGVYYALIVVAFKLTKPFQQKHGGAH